MPKTIKSQRNPLSKSELKRYKINLKQAQNIRKELKLKYPTLRWLQIFTEAQAGGVCRSKMWGLLDVDIVKLEKHIKKCNLNECNSNEKYDLVLKSENYYGLKSLVIYCY